MALQTRVIEGKSIEFDTEVQEEFINKFLPDGGTADVNLLDYTAMLAGVMLATATKNSSTSIQQATSIYINGKSIVLDAGTNYVSAYSNDSKALARAIVTAFSGAGIGYVAGGIATFAVGPAGGTAVGFFVGNAASSSVGNTWDYLFGPDINVLVSVDNKSALFRSGGSLENTLLHHWNHSEPNRSLTAIANTYESYGFSSSSETGAVNFEYKKADNKYTYSSGGTKENIEELLKYLEVGNLPEFKTDEHNSPLFKNFMNLKTPLSASDLKDKATLYASFELQGFVFEDEITRYSNLNPNDYSDMFLHDRANMFNTYIKEPSVSGRFTVYQDLNSSNNNGLITYDPDDILYGHRDGNVGKVVFGTDGNDTYGSPTGLGASNGELHLFGMDGNDILYGDISNDYLEGGKGFDRLQGGADYDTYISDNGDTIMDSDGKGIVYFQEEHLSGGTIKAGASCDTTEFYYGDG
jgi:hypothetical protein